MNRFITARRVERAKTLLATTHWQIKEIARATGHANANWFCHLFRLSTGLTPGALPEGIIRSVPLTIDAGFHRSSTFFPDRGVFCLQIGLHTD